MLSHAKEVNTAEGQFALDEKADAKMLSRLARPEFPQQETIELVEALGAQHIVDVGAHVGTVSVPLAKRGRRVVAFEPDPVSFSYLVRNGERNAVRIDARNKGLGEKPGYGSVVAPQQGNAGAHRLVQGGDIPVSTLDAEVSETDFIKIDVEGMELLVLKGGEQLIGRSRPAVFFEVNLSALRAHRIRLTSLAEFFSSRQYRLYFVEHHTLYALPGIRLTALLLAPRSVLFSTSSAPFDVLALPVGSTLPYRTHPPFVSGVYLLMRYIKVQYGRLFN